MKKILSVFLVSLLFVLLCAMPGAAAESTAPIVIHIRNDIAGLDSTSRDFCEILSGDIVFNESPNTTTVGVYNYAESIYTDKLKPGRTYHIDYAFTAKEGTTLPEELTEENISFQCDKGCTVWWYGITTGAENAKGLAVNTSVTVPGNPFQMFFGRIADIILKIKAWSPY